MVFLQAKHQLGRLLSGRPRLGFQHVAQRQVPFTSRAGNRLAFSTTANRPAKNRRGRKSKAPGAQLETNPCDAAEANARRSDGLNKEQRRVFDMVLNQEQNVFFTGPAGTGKSMLLQRVVHGLTEKYPDQLHCVAVTASTGIAASNIGGTTLHRFAGIGLGQAPTEKLISDILGDKSKSQRWIEVKVLVIDEISMIDAVLFDKLDEIARNVRKIDAPFGGIQLVITGDFFQLPPVDKGPVKSTARFCFESKAWEAAIRHSVCLTEIYRQKDPKFTGMLNEIREGVVSQATIDILGKISRPLKVSKKNKTEATELFSLRREADTANLRRMEKLVGMPTTYVAEDDGSVEDVTTRERLLSDCIAPKTLHLKKGAQVMLVKNMTKRLINGSQGVVLGFDSSITFSQSFWENVDPFQDSSDTPSSSMKLSLYPVVRFSLIGGGSRVELCEPMEWAVERWVFDPEEEEWHVEILATRSQVPLVLAWAISIHKAQGQTMARVKVDLGRVFETGQSYVALSRAQSLSGLQVVGFDPSKVVAHPKAKKFYARFSKTG